VALLRLGYRAAYRLLQAWAFVRRPRVRGTMVSVRDAADRVLLVRHTYGDRRRWELPGGWVHGDEDPLVAARREVREELGIDVEPQPLAVIQGDWEFKHEQLSWFEAEWPGGRGTYDPVEIAEVRWFGPGALPRRLGTATRAVLDRLERAQGRRAGSDYAA
jgi:8-oxo-dGTP pyrophosphatase MutT (NUDIX family)